MGRIASIEEARQLPGLRLVLTAGVPGPWGEMAKGFFQVKGIAYVPVAQEGGGANEELRRWTGHVNAPIAIYADEPPRAGRDEILFLAERLEPEPPLLPRSPEQRALAFGLLHEIAGEMGFGWCRRLMMLDDLARLPDLPPQVAGFRDRLQRRYGGDAAQAAEAPARCAEVMQLLAARLHAQRDRGCHHLIGDGLGAVDIAWACFAALIQPLPEELCRMPAMTRAAYTTRHPRLLEALDPILLEHRDRVYRDALRLPVEPGQ